LQMWVTPGKERCCMHFRAQVWGYAPSTPIGSPIKNQRGREYRSRLVSKAFKLACLVDRPLKFIPAICEGETKWTTKNNV
jgi:hypothetical protein